MSEERRQDEAGTPAPKTPGPGGDAAAAKDTRASDASAGKAPVPSSGEAPAPPAGDTSAAPPAPAAASGSGAKGGGRPPGRGEGGREGSPGGKRGRGRRGRDRDRDQGRGSDTGRQAAPRGHGHGGAPRLVPIPPPDVLQRIVVQGDATVIIEWAEKIGKALRGKVQLANIRRIYGTLKRLQLGELDEGAQRELLLLRPRLAYAVKRQSSATGLAQVLDPALKLVSERAHLDQLVDFFEAILAYHRE